MIKSAIVGVTLAIGWMMIIQVVSWSAGWLRWRRVFQHDAILNALAETCLSHKELRRRTGLRRRTLLARLSELAAAGVIRCSPPEQVHQHRVYWRAQAGDPWE